MERVLNPKPFLPIDRQLFSNKALKAMIVPLLIEQLLQRDVMKSCLDLIKNKTLFHL